MVKCHTKTWDRFKTLVSQITMVLRALDKHRPPFPVALAQRTNRITRRRRRCTKSQRNPCARLSLPSVSACSCAACGSRAGVNATDDDRSRAGRARGWWGRWRWPLDRYRQHLINTETYPLPLTALSVVQAQILLSGAPISLSLMSPL